MKKLFITFTTCLAWLTIMTGSTTISYAQSAKWSTAYYAGWSQGYNNTGLLPAQNIDFGAVTHIMHFALVPRADGTLDDASNSVTAFNSNAVITAAHAAGKKVLITVGGFYTDGSFRSATSSSIRATFVSNLVNLMKTRGYDGIDVDWEPLGSGDAAQFVAFITELRTAMNAVSPRPLLTAATAWGAPIFSQVKDQFDQINLMTYDLAGAWSGWVTWHNAPISAGGFTFPSTGNPPPSSEGMINEFIAAGIPASKLGIGIDFYGYVWSGGAGTSTGGATEPRQTWTTAPSVQANVPYSTIMDTYYQSQYYRFDQATGVSYLSIDNAGSSNDKFISYDDEATIAAKYNYVKSKGLGGAIIWELGGGYRSNMPAGQKDLLLQAVKLALSGMQAADITPPTISITSPLNGASLTGIVAFTATATDNIGVTGLQFAIDGTNIATELTAAPYLVSVNTATLSAGTHTISAIARDAAGNRTTSSVSITVLLPLLDVTSPQVALTTPANNATVSGSVALNATASDNVGISGVQFTLDGTNIGSEDVTAPYSFLWNSAQSVNGSHIVAAIARDAAGNTSTASVTVTVSNPADGSSSDLIVYNDALLSPWINSSWNTNVTFSSAEQTFAGAHSIKAALTSAWGGLSLHYDNWGTSLSISPSDYTGLNFAIFAATSGTQLSVFAENDLGQSFPAVQFGAVAVNQWSNISIPMNQLNPNGQIIHRITIQEISGTLHTFYIDNIRFVSANTTPAPTADTVKPTVAFVSPINGVTVSGTLTINVNASDNKKVSGVQFKIDGANFGVELTATPYSIVWNTTNIANGSHTVSAVVRDSSGNTQSASVVVSVANITPSPIPSADVTIFGDSLCSPWMNTSWNTAVMFGSTDQKYSGTSSIKAAQNAWGGVRFHSGSWSNPVALTNAQYTNVTFAIHGGSAGISMGVWLENDANGSFPSIKYVWVPANQWTTFSYPLTQLNPKNLPVHSLVIQDMTGRVKTFYIDDVKFVSNTQSLAITGAAQAKDVKAAPIIFGMEQNFPNPFNPATVIRYSVPFTASVQLEVFTITGQQIALLTQQVLSPGEYGATFDAKSCASGVYLYRLTATNLDDPKASPLILTKRMILMK